MAIAAQALGVRGLQLPPRHTLVQVVDHLAVRAHALGHLDHLLIEQLGQPDVAIEDARAVLVGDAQLVAKAAGDEEHRGLALALEQRVGGDRSAHLHRLDLLDRDRLSRLHGEQVANGGHRRVTVLLGVLREQLVGDEAAVGLPAHHVGERSAAVDPELPFLRFAHE